MAVNPEKRALLIAGPTASGKSALALKLAGERNGIIINADALQVYGELRILSARPTAAEERLFPHRLYGHVSGRQSYSVAHWLVDVRREMAKAWEQGLLPVITGGTGLYFKALEQGLADVPPIPSEVREYWRSFSGDLHAELRKLDCEAAGRLMPNDRQRIVRALEVASATGRTLATWQAEAQSSAPLLGAAVERMFIDVARAELWRRAEARFDAMLGAGAMEEVRAIADFDPSLPMMKAIGVSELLAYLRGEIPLDEAVARAKASTRQYIKRQFTWWRGAGARLTFRNNNA